MTLNELIEIAKERGVDFDAELLYNDYVDNRLVGVNFACFSDIKEIDDGSEEFEYFQPSGKSTSIIMLSGK